MTLIALAFSLLAADPERMEFTVDGATREALVAAPSKKSDGAPPLVFGFHGHGGSMRNAARTFRLHEEWPEAVVVYMQGLPTKGKTDPEGKKAGWQKDVGDYEDRDLKFFDVVLAAMKDKHGIDERRIYCTGHSNGGGFTYLLWSQRADLFAAIAPSAAGGRHVRTSKPLPVLHLASESDAVVPFATQSLVIGAVKKLNGCEGDGKEWATGATIFESSKGAPMVVFLHDGGHKYPPAGPALIVKFFKEHARPE